jgi:hypothetical protein
VQIGWFAISQQQKQQAKCANWLVWLQTNHVGGKSGARKPATLGLVSRELREASGDQPPA